MKNAVSHHDKGAISDNPSKSLAPTKNHPLMKAMDSILGSILLYIWWEFLENYEAFTQKLS